MKKVSQPLISVIIPIYNTEMYLEECVQSVQRQTYENIEILLINDGSKDKSGRICEKFCEKDSRIQVYHQENAGLSAARNKGIELAKGDYLYFLDSDDYIQSKCLEVLYFYAKKYDADISFGEHVRFQDGEEVEERWMKKDGEVLKKNDLLECLTRTGEENYDESKIICCNKLIRKELFYRVLFLDGKWHEDEFIIHRLYDLSECISYTETVGYYYRERLGSITRNAEVNMQSVMDGLDASYDRMCFYKEHYKDLSEKSLIAYLENLTIQYLLLREKKTDKGFRWYICKRMIKVFPRLLITLPIRRWKRYTIFLLSPVTYQKKYWD